MMPLSDVVISCLLLLVRHIAVVISPGQHLTRGSPLSASKIVTVLAVLLEMTMDAVESSWVLIWNSYGSADT